MEGSQKFTNFCRRKETVDSHNTEIVLKQIIVFMNMFYVILGGAILGDNINYSSQLFSEPSD